MLRIIPSRTLKNIPIFLSTMAATALDLTEMTSPLDLLKQLSARFLLMQVLFFFGPPCGTFACLHSPLLHFTLDLFLPRYPSRSVLDLGSSSDRLWALTFGRKLRTRLTGIFRILYTLTPPTVLAFCPIRLDKPHNNFSKHTKHSHKFPSPSDNTSQSRLRAFIPQSRFWGLYF